MKLAIKIFCGFVVLMLIIASGMVGFVWYELRPEVLTENLRELLSETLDTEVKLNYCKLNLKDQELSVYGLNVKDRQKVDMLSVDTIFAKVDLRELWYRRLLVKEFEINSARCIFYKENKESDPNYQFVVNAITVIAKDRTREQAKKQKKAKLKLDVSKFSLHNINIKWDIKSAVCRRSKEYRKIHPHAGDFDARHIDVNLSYDATDINVVSDNASMKIDNFCAYDRLSGLEITNLSTVLSESKQSFRARNLHVVSKHTIVDAALVTGTIPSRKHHTVFSLKADSVTAHTILKDISRPFAPALRKFTTPLELSVNVVGNDSSILFNKIHVYTKDKRLSIRAHGWISFPKMGKKRKRPAKYDTNLFFAVQSMHARRGITKQILKHFAKVSPSFATMLIKAGDVRFTGNLYIPYKKEHIWGTLKTRIGNLKADVWFYNKKKTMKGSVSSNNVNLYMITGNKNLNDVSFRASFDLDIAKHVPVNKLPIGKLSGRALDVGYKNIHLNNIDFDIASDGKNVVGCVDHDKKFADVSCDFSFQGTDIKNTLKLKPHVEIHLKNIWKATGIPKLWNSIFGKKKKKE